MINLTEILTQAEEYAKARDGATPGEWRYYGSARHKFIDAGHNGVFAGKMGDIFGLFVDKSGHNAEPDAAFVVAAKNYDSPAIIRQLVERIKELESINDQLRLLI